jgi:hypothetical protein
MVVPTSDILWAPSATNAKLPDNIPIAMFKIDKRLFPTMPAITALVPSLFLVVWSIVTLP